MKTKIWLLIISAAIIASCSSAPSSNSTANNIADNVNSSINLANNNKVLTQLVPDVSPTEVGRIWYQAWRKRDVKGVRSAASKRWNESIDDETIKSLMEDEIFREAHKAKEVELRNEKINGGTASVEWKSPHGWLKLDMVNEDREWKVASEDFIEKF